MRRPSKRPEEHRAAAETHANANEQVAELVDGRDGETDQDTEQANEEDPAESPRAREQFLDLCQSPLVKRFDERRLPQHQACRDCQAQAGKDSENDTSARARR
jgi:hypothetical protein